LLRKAKAYGCRTPQGQLARSVDWCRRDPKPISRLPEQQPF